MDQSSAPGMTIAFIPPKGSDASLDRVRQTTMAALAGHHQLRTCPAEYRLASTPRRREIVEAWLAGSDILMGCPDTQVLEVRQQFDRSIPWVLFMLGRMPRGAPTMSVRARYLDTRDVLLCNCTADAAMSRMFFPNATVEVVPFAVDDTLFAPGDAVRRAATRANLGIGDDEQVLLYAGRLSLEKNVYTLLKTFRVVLNAMPEGVLIVAGDEAERPFAEFGTFSLDTGRTLKRLCAQLSLDSHRVRFIGACNPTDLRALYGAADVLVNLTVNHDENFGYAQVEAMACGLPVVGTAWGGLKDTIVDGITGVQVPTIVTAAGVKVDWWTAANAIVGLLRSGEAARMRGRCGESARERYSMTRYGDTLKRIVRGCAEASTRPGEPLQVSAFAGEYWAACALEADERPPYRRGARSLDLYRELIAPYASATSSHANGRHEAWVLAAALCARADGRIAINDPICPIEVDVPEPLSVAVRILSRRFAEHPVQADASVGGCGAAAREALAWMHEAGLVLPTRLGVIDPACASTLGQPMFEIRELDHKADIVWLS
jgi:glycosyltransferase involved in cell wall biosynthesis